jgi:hypothetical protein
MLVLWRVLTSFTRNILSRTYPSGLISETLRTFELLFPTHDTRSCAILSRCVATNNLDPSLETSHFYQRHHDHPRDAVQPADLGSLCDKFPHWSDRLYHLWLEADNPAPVSKIGWWSEGKNSPRFTYWATNIALSFAVFFGITATMLSAAQVLISYRAWKEPNPSQSTT